MTKTVIVTLNCWYTLPNKKNKH